MFKDLNGLQIVPGNLYEMWSQAVNYATTPFATLSSGNYLKARPLGMEGCKEPKSAIVMCGQYVAKGVA